RGPTGDGGLLRRRTGHARPRRVLWCALASGTDRPAAHRRRDRDAGVYGRTDLFRWRPRPVRRPGRLPRQRGASRDAAALLPAPVPAGRTGGERGAGGEDRLMATASG